MQQRRRSGVGQGRGVPVVAGESGKGRGGALLRGGEEVRGAASQHGGRRGPEASLSCGGDEQPCSGSRGAPSGILHRTLLEQ